MKVTVLTNEILIPGVVFMNSQNSSVAANKGQGTPAISFPPDKALWSLFRAQYGSKTTPVFICTDGEALWSLISDLVSCAARHTVQKNEVLR